MKPNSTSRRHRMGPWVLMGTILLAGCRQETAEPLLNRDLGSGGNLVLLPTRPLQLDSAITSNARVQLIELVDPEQEELKAVDKTIKTPQELIDNFTEMMQAGQMQDVAGFLVNPRKFQDVRKLLLQTVMLIVAIFLFILVSLAHQRWVAQGQATLLSGEGAMPVVQPDSGNPDEKRDET